MTKLTYTTMCLIFGVIAAAPAHAQRTMAGQGFLGVDALWCGAPGGQIRCGQYFGTWSMWEGRLSVAPFEASLSTGDRLQYMDIVAGVDYSVRVLGRRSRSVNLYLGAGVFGGYEMYDPFLTLPSNIDLGFDRGVIIYGVSVAAHAEFFFLPRFAFVLGAELPVNFSSYAGRWHCPVSAGLRYNL